MIFPRQSGGLLPGGFQFQDPRVPAMIWSDTMFLDDRVSQVLKFRVANPQIYDPAKDLNELDANHVRQEVLKYNLGRLGSSYFVVTGSELVDVHNAATGEPKCSCGVEMKANYCTGCFTPKVISWQCPKCMKIFKV